MENKKIKFYEPLECPGGVHKGLKSRPVGPANEYGMIPTEIYCEDCTEVVVPFLAKTEVPAVVPVTFDIAEAKKKILLYQEEVNKMFEKAEVIIIDSDATNKEATELGTTAKALYKKIKAVPGTIPLYVEAKEFVGKVDDLVKMLTEKLEDPQGKKKTIVSITKAKLSQYTAKLESERRIQEAAAREARDKLQEKLNEDAKKTGTLAPQVPDVIIPKKETTVRTESGSAHAVHRWVHEITDLLKVPVELLRRAVDPIQSKQGAAALSSVIQDEVRKGVRDSIDSEGQPIPGIPGVKIFEETTTSFRV